MEEHGTAPRRQDPSLRPLLRSLGLELLFYAPLVTAYFALVLHFGREPIQRLYESGRASYAYLSLALIVGQAVLLEILTSWLLRRIGLRH